jgi:3-deoxy-manno-octulosonate cytidylyltransferase (CMP-KDO synthetase)
MIQWVYESAAQLFDQLVVATDDRRIHHAVETFGGRSVMTSPTHGSGTERCAEALRLVREQSGLSFTHVINIQGDEPLIKKEQLELLTDCLQDPGVEIATLIRPITHASELQNPNVVKVVVDKSFKALYFSRSPIPFVRDPQTEQIRAHCHYVHLGLYGFRCDVIEKLVELPPSGLEMAESLEQLRWLENGFRIQTKVTLLHTQGVDTPEDLDAIRAKL